MRKVGIIIFVDTIFALYCFVNRVFHIFKYDRKISHWSQCSTLLYLVLLTSMRRDISKNDVTELILTTTNIFLKNYALIEWLLIIYCSNGFSHFKYHLKLFFGIVFLVKIFFLFFYIKNLYLFYLYYYDQVNRLVILSIIIKVNFSYSAPF